MPDTILAHAEAALARCDALGVEATRIFLSLDRARILAEAAALDARVTAGEALPLAGLLVSIKDLVDRRGERTTAGSVFLEARDLASVDATIVARLEAAGALLFGRTSQTEFAYSGLGINPHHGTPGAFFDRSRVPGGSSSGAALSVAHGLVDLAIGTDTGGSVRIPAAVNGLYGFKPTAREVPTDGVYPLSQDMDSIGPLGTDLARTLQVAEVLRGRPFEPRDVPLRLGVPLGPLTEGLGEPVARCWQAARDALAAADVELVEVDLRWLEETAPANRVLIACEAHDRYRDALDALERVGDPDVLRRMRFAEQVDEATREAAAALREASIQRFATSLEEAHVDAIASPTLAVVPPTIEHARAHFDADNGDMLRLTAPINFVDGCAVTLPLGAMADGDGAPGALQLAAASGADDRLVALASIVDAALDGLR